MIHLTMAGLSLRASEEMQLLLQCFLSIWNRIDSKCVHKFSYNSQAITLQGYFIQKYFYFWTKFLVAEEAAMLIIQRHNNSAAQGKAAMLETFTGTSGTFFSEEMWLEAAMTCGIFFL